MWYPATVTAGPTEPVSIAQARQQARTDTDTYHDDELTRLITVARQHVENYCGLRCATTTVEVKCDGFADMARLSEAPVQSVTSITYLDTDGASQTLSTDVYELRADGLEVAIVLKYGQAWPSIRPGSRITVTLVAGYATTPAAMVHAMLLHLAEQFDEHAPVAIDGMTTFDALLINYRRNA